MTVFTAFFCGTESNSFDFANTNYHSGELVSSLARNCTGLEFVDWIICDGPGSGNYQEDEKFVRPGNYYKWQGGLTGKGWEENVRHALAMIHGEAKWSRKHLTDLNYRILKEAGIPIEDAEIDLQAMAVINPLRKITQQDLQMQKIKIFRKKKPVTQINAIGWSRGAVTTHMFANALANDDELKKLPVNIIAVDPVPGAGNFQSHRTSIPGNVKNYIGFYARDERSLGFAATLPSFAKGVDAKIYPMPGRHSTLVGNAGNYIGGNGANVFYGPGRVVRMLAEKYLTDWGTPLGKRGIYSGLEMLRCYDEMLGQHEQFKQLSTTVYTTRKGQSSGRDIGVGQGLFSTKFQQVNAFETKGPFVNWHHAKLFHEFGGFGNSRDYVKNLRKALFSHISGQSSSTVRRVLPRF